MSSKVPWKAKFNEGITQFRLSNFSAALKLFSEAAEMNPHEKVVFDSRAAVFERMNCFTDALADSKRVIDLSPDSWQGYLRAARLFCKAQKPQAALKMIKLASERLQGADPKRLDELRTLRQQALDLYNTQQKRVSETVYHFGKLPIELASTIFTLIVHALGGSSGTAVTISHVCRNWRTIALSTPGLWRSLTLSSVTPQRKIDAWFERSGSVFTELRVMDSFWASKSLRWQAFEALAWTRLKNLELNVSDDAGHVDDQLPHIFSRINLEAFTLRCNHRFGIVERGPSYWRPIGALAVSSITRLELDAPILPWNFLSSFETLQEISLTTSTSDQSGLANFLSILENNPILQSIIIDVAWDCPTLDTDTQQRIPLLNLTHLELGGRLWDPYSILSRICAPSLSVLRIGRDLRCTQAGLLDALLAYPITELTELALRSPAFPISTLVVLFKSTPNLTTLKMTSMMFNCEPSPNDVLEALAGRGAGTEAEVAVLLCPELQRIDFSQCDELEAGPLMRVVQSRLPMPSEADGETQREPAVKRIVSVMIDACPRMDSAILPWLRRNVPDVSCVYMKKREARHGRWT